MDSHTNKRSKLIYKRINQLVLIFLFNLVNLSLGNPVYMKNLAHYSVQTGRNIRHLPCIVKRNGMEGVCMFAIDCLKSNGTHLGTCIDRFYFGSCCQLHDEKNTIEQEIVDNRIDQNTITDFQEFHPSTIIDNKVILSSSSSKRPPTHTSTLSNTQKPSINIYYDRPTTLVTLIGNSKPELDSTLLPATTKFEELLLPESSTNKFISTSTENIKLSTFQSISQADQRVNTTFAPTTSFSYTTPRTTTTGRPTIVKVVTLAQTSPTIKLTTTEKPILTVINRRTTTTLPPPSKTQTTLNTIPAIVPTRPRPTKRPSVPPITTKQPQKLSTSSTTTTRITTTRTKTTTTPVTPSTTTTASTTTKQPVRPSTSRKPTTQQKIKPTTTNSTLAPSTTSRPKPTRTSRPPIISATAEQLTTLSYVQTTKAPRPKPKPSSTATQIDSTTTSVLAEKPTIVKQTTTTTTTKPTRKTTVTTRTTTTTTTTTTKPTTTKPTTTPSITRVTVPTTASTTTTPPKSTTTTITTTEEAEISQPVPVQESTQQRPIDSSDATTLKPGIVTWSNFNENKKNDTWVLVPNVEYEVTTSNKPSILLDEEESKLTTVNVSATTEDYLPTEATFRPSTAEIIPIVIYNKTTTERYPEITTEFVTTVNLNLGTNSTIQPISVLQELTTSRPALLVTSDESIISTTMNGFVVFRDNITADTTMSPEFSSDNTTTTTGLVSSTTQNLLEGVDYKEICGKRMFPEPRIVGGTKAAFGRWPWQISLRQWRTSTYLHKCGSALLNENWAITAAHCVDNVPPADLLLRLGEYDLAEEEEPYGYQERRVQIVASHPQFDPRTFEYDLALLRFYEPVVFQPNIIPVCVPETDETFIGRTAFVTGWGRLYEDGPLPSVLQEVSVPVINNNICEDMYRSRGYIEHIPHIFICAGWKKGGYDSCEGDSGGPMVIQREDKRFLLAGIISWGIGCAEPNQPGVYTRISEFRDWINQILQF